MVDSHAGRKRYKVTDRIEARTLARMTKHQPVRIDTVILRNLAAGDLSHMTVSSIWVSTASTRTNLKATRFQRQGV